MYEDPVVEAIIKLLRREGGEFKGTASRLLFLLNFEVPLDQRGKSWPQNAWGMGNKLAEITNVLDAFGIECRYNKGGGGKEMRRFWELKFKTKT